VKARLRECQAWLQLHAAVRASEIPLLISGTCSPACPPNRGKAIFLGDGRVEIDNNLVENAIRPTALGEKNWLFMGHADAGKRGAIVYTIVESCRRRGLDPCAYLKHVLTCLPRMTNHQVPQVTPEAWSKVHLQVQRQAVS
jgi:transposase